MGISATALPEHELLLEQLETLCQERLDGRDRAATIDFLRAYYATVSPEVLGRCHPPDLLSRALAHRALLQQPRQLPARVESSALPEGRGWLLRCVAPDMPFLVDTVLIAVRRAGGHLRWLVHPVLPVRRDAQGALLAVGDGPDAAAESLMQIEFGGLDAERVEALCTEVLETLGRLRDVVSDYPAMRQRVAESVEAMSRSVEGIEAEERAEIAEFLRWLDEDHFTFLGYIRSHAGAGESLTLDADSGLGLWRKDIPDPIRIAPASEMSKYAASRRPLIITTTEGRSPIHHDEYCDVVVIKLYADDGRAEGTVRFLGLFSSEVYNTLPRRIPVVRRKIEQVMQRSGLRGGGHAAKQLRDILDNLPRNELFQSSVSELAALATGVRTVRESQQLRLFLRRDRYGRFYSCLIYQHRERYSSTTRRAMSNALQRLLGGTEVEHEVSFQRDGLARIHLTVRTPPGSETPLTVAELETRLVDLATRWEDAAQAALFRMLPDPEAEALAGRWLGVAPASYRDEVPAAEAATDLQYLHMVGEEGDLRVRLLAVGEGLELKLYGRGVMPSLSLILPRLEHFGLRVLAQHPYLFGEDGWVQYFDLRFEADKPPARERRAAFEAAFLAAWRGQMEQDGLNALVLGSGLDWREVALVRALVKYTQQTGLPFSQLYIERILREHTDFVSGLLLLFRARFAPGEEGDGEAIAADLSAMLESVQSLDADRLLACLLSVVRATVRTNFFQPDADGAPKAHISLKIRSAEVPELPQPRPMVETFVYSPEVEGIHLRGGPVSRGGLRWSDRREDFRTEVLGLVKAQMVKNAVIVPTGAKGGFVVKSAVDRRDRQAWQAAGVACYQTFIRGLLDITDNLVDGALVPPEQVRRHDGDDPYLVVAADKGTATFSDIANGISLEYGFWLGDAFASGGSAGYDHKKMGITARGAWESVKRHFRSLGRDCQAEDFTVVGIGDMAGDVFGNGMLLSPHIRLLAAFNHLHIFIDPNPDAAQSFAERQRLFALPRSAWTDYETALISKGGGVYERSAKTIALSPEAREALGISESSLSPTALIHRLLQAPVDLLWNGGIGTYVKAKSESHAEVGDRANDGLRINGEQLRAKVVGEGGNLGLTQKARIEAALRGVLLITDFNDNVGGVNSSDREVNLKIPLNAEMAAGRLPLEERNRLLESMTEDLATAVLRDSDLQTQGICMQARIAPARINEHAGLIRLLERSAGLDRAIEFLPDEEQIAERRQSGQGFTMPEIAVLVSYAKLDLFSAVVNSPLPDDPALVAELDAYFPAAVRKKHLQALHAHRLRREIIATVTTNRLVNRMGPSFARRLAEENQWPLAQVVQAWLAAGAMLDAEARSVAFEQAGADVQQIYIALDRLAGLLKHMSLWLLAEFPQLPSLQELTERFAAPLQTFEQQLEQWLAPAYQERLKKIREERARQGLPAELAAVHARHHVLGSGLDVLALSQAHKLPLEEVAPMYFSLGGQLEMPWLQEQINALSVSNRWQAMARNQLRADCYRLHRALCESVLQAEGDTVAKKLGAWLERRAEAQAMVLSALAELKTLDRPDSAGITVLLGQLRRLVVH
ncbi:MAG: NAD-glutamate dehydrogenase [Oceanococcaceae bacterium]